jgi:beta-lactamase regulating signal transducer with metallopeptidase domain
MKSFIDMIKNISPSESRENLKSIFAVILGTGSWILLGWLIYAQFVESAFFARKIAQLEPTEKDKIALIKDANETVNKTTNSLYALLTPVATAITGYFFISSGAAASKKHENDSTNPPKLIS